MCVSRSPRGAALALALLVALGAGPAHAADDVELELVSKAIVGQGEPALILHVHRDLSTLRLRLVSPDGQELTQAAGPTRKGKDIRVALPASLGRTHLAGELQVTFPNGDAGSMPVAFDVEVLEPMRVDVPEDRLDLAHGRLGVVLSRPASRCTYEIVLDGKAPRRGVATFADEPAGTPLEIGLPVDTSDVVLKIRLTCYDPDGMYNGRELSPWRIEIPHDEVSFQTGESRSEPSEQPKLDRAYDEIATALRRYGKLVKVRLFIVGHTDTVGEPAANLRLSLARAVAIGAYLEKRGVAIPVLVTGIGERVLVVATADEVDEPRNRGAKYILSIDPPYPYEWQSL